MAKSQSKKLILIDGNAIIHRSYHALPPFTTKKGELVNAVYGFASTVISIIHQFQPEYIIATFDLAGPTFRHLDYADYKATRVKADDALYEQIPRVKEVTAAFGIPIREAQGFEADDVIGTLAKEAKENNPDLEIIIVTGDMDTLQLVDEQTKVYTMRRGLTDAVLYGPTEIFERYSLKPEQLIDYKGLRGDPSDNIPGVKGIGEKTATDLLKTYGTLENVYAHITELKKPLQEKLEHDRMMAKKSKELATISREAPVELELEKAATHEYDQAALFALFDELNFHSLKKRIGGEKTGKSPSKKSTPENLPGVKDFKFEIVNEKNSTEILDSIAAQSSIALRLKTDGQKLAGAAIAYKTGRVAYFGSEDKKILSRLKNILADDRIEKISFDLKSDLKALWQNGLDIKGPTFDLLISAYLLNPGRKVVLSELVAEHLGEELEEEKKGQLGLEIESEEEQIQKISTVADYIFKLKTIHAAEIGKISTEQIESGNQPEHTLREVLSKVEMPLVPVLAKMELAGVRLNTLVFKGISEKITERLAKLEQSIYKLSGETFNIASPKQLAEVLFEKMQLPSEGLKKGKTGVISTASGELEKLRGESKIIEKIEEYREISKLKNTYLDTLPEMVDQESRLHTTFNQAVAATGRLSSSDPNLQNIPIRTELGQLLRVAFVAQDGWKLISADYSQIDLRVVAHVSRDKKMTELFLKGEDIHRATAAEIHKIPLSQVSDKIRRTAKELNFGVIYGMGTFGFASRTGISREEAREFIDAYFDRFQGVAKYMRDTREAAKQKGYVETEIGRRRYIPEIHSPNFQVQSAAERMAINMPIQGLSADIMKIAMLKIDEAFGSDPDVRMILQIHDEIILEAKEERAEEFAQKVKTILENAYQLRVPLVANVEIGDNWGEI